jgi:tryptophan synthase beta chain
MQGNRRSKTIVFGLTGTGYFDMVAYEKYHDGLMTDYVPTDEDLQKGFDEMPKV